MGWLRLGGGRLQANGPLRAWAGARLLGAATAARGFSERGGGLDDRPPGRFGAVLESHWRAGTLAGAPKRTATARAALEPRVIIRVSRSAGPVTGSSGPIATCCGFEKWVVMNPLLR